MNAAKIEHVRGGSVFRLKYDETLPTYRLDPDRPRRRNQRVIYVIRDDGVKGFLTLGRVVYELENRK